MSFVDFILLGDPMVRYILISVILIGISSTMVGSFNFLRKRALIGDVIAHSVLPGICLAFILSQRRDPVVLMIGASITGFLSTIAVDWIKNNTKLKVDTINALILSVFFGIGVVFLSVIQNSGNAAQAGLDHFLFGNAADLLPADLVQISVIAGVISIAVILLFKEFTLISFDRDFAVSSGLPVKFLEVLLAILTVMAIAVGIQAVGVVLMAAMLITPIAAGRIWTDNLKKMIMVGSLVAVIGAVIGTYISSTYPNMPAGPWIIVGVSMIAFISLLFAPKKGFISRYYKRYLFRRKMLTENILKLFYHLGEANGSVFGFRTRDELLQRRSIPDRQLDRGLRFLKRKDLVLVEGGKMQLSKEGAKIAGRIVRVHRLWEIYLSEFLRIQPDHVHDDAEAIEHIITPELELELEKLLKTPKEDPHGKSIPYHG